MLHGKTLYHIQNQKQHRREAFIYCLLCNCIYNCSKNMTMLKNKRITFSLIFVCLVMVSPMAKAQLGGLGGLLGGGGGGGGGLGGLLGGGGLGGLLGGGGLGGLLGNGGLGGLLGGGGGGGVLGGILGLINIQGVLRCSANGNVSAPAFVNAGVQLQCGGQNNVVSTSTTNAAGLFSMLVNPIQLVLSTLLSDCQVAVTTPLSTCNAALPTGQLLSSSLALVGETVSGLLRVANLRPTGFTLA
ncbi:phylloplanin [Brassica rapa]|uniref:phylloplanin n=1 Tax=Brassica campestris TaxID=3711 RepID=UPI00142E8006|nr:phylloplanin [Brassica rapa]